MNTMTHEPAATAATTTGRAAAVRQAASLLRAALPVTGLVGLLAWFGSASPYFLETSNLQNLVSDAATLLLCAFGMTVVILVGEIDLSVGAVTSLLAVLLGVALSHGLPWPFAALLVVLCGIAIAVVNGLFAILGDIPSFIVTLGTFSAATGVAYILTSGVAVPIADNAFLDLFYVTTWLGLPIPLYVVLLALAGVWLLQRRTATGREMEATGANREAARLSGVHVARVRLAAFVVLGALVGTGAVLAAARLGSGAPNAFPTLTLDVIAAVIIGGAALTGGRASVLRTLVGALLIAVLNNGLILLNVNSYYQYVIKGAIILVAVLLDRANARGDG